MNYYNTMKGQISQNDEGDDEVLHTAEEPRQAAAPLRQGAEGLQKPAETSTELPQEKLRTAAHSIMVRVAVRMFEDVRVSRSPHTITNWCNPNSKGVSRLDCWQDPDDHTYYITQESIERVIAEEVTKGKGISLRQPTNMEREDVQQSAAEIQTIASEVQLPAVEHYEDDRKVRHPGNNKDAELRELRRLAVEQENTIKGKDALIDTFQQGMDKFGPPNRA